MTSVLSAARHARDMLAYAATRPGHDRHDADMARALRTDPTDLDLPAGLDLRWLGVAGYALTYEGTTILIDPYVTRLTFGDMIRRRAIPADAARLDAYVPTADAILLGHTHFDHALDAPAIARRDGARVYGGTSAQHLLGLHGLADQATVVEAHRTFSVGPFDITFVPSLHAKLALGLSVPNDGEITCDHVGDLVANAYCCGEVYGMHIAVAGITLYHQGSANLVDDEIRHRDVDWFLCGIAGRQFTDDYLERILRRLQPRKVIAMHYDDFFVPLGEPSGFAFGVDLVKVPDEVQAVSRDIEVLTLTEPRPLLPQAEAEAGVDASA